MNEQQYEVIQQAKGILESKGVKGVQFMKMEGNVAVFEAFGTRIDEYLLYTVDTVEAIENEEIEIVQEYILIQEGDEDDDEIDVSSCKYTFDENMERVSFEDETLKVYKKMAAAIKFAKKECESRIANFEIANC